MLLICDAGMLVLVIQVSLMCIYCSDVVWPCVLLGCVVTVVFTGVLVVTSVCTMAIVVAVSMVLRVTLEVVMIRRCMALPFMIVLACVYGVVGCGGCGVRGAAGVADVTVIAGGL